MQRRRVCVLPAVAWVRVGHRDHKQRWSCCLAVHTAKLSPECAMECEERTSLRETGSEEAFNTQDR